VNETPPFVIARSGSDAAIQKKNWIATPPLAARNDRWLGKFHNNDGMQKSISQQRLFFYLRKIIFLFNKNPILIPLKFQIINISETKPKHSINNYPLN